jgi:hypothetical protein
MTGYLKIQDPESAWGVVEDQLGMRKRSMALVSGSGE